MRVYSSSRFICLPHIHMYKVARAATTKRNLRLLRRQRIKRATYSKMPLCLFRTNLPRQALSPDFGVTLSKLVAQLLNKDVQRVTVLVEADKEMVRGGDSDKPTIWLNIDSINVFNANANKQYATKLREFISTSLKETPVDSNRIVITLRDLPATDAV